MVQLEIRSWFVLRRWCHFAEIIKSNLHLFAFLCKVCAREAENETVGCFISIFFSTDSVACLSEYVTGDTIHWCGGNFGIAFAVLVHGQKIGSSQHSQKKYFSKIPKKVSL